MLPCRIMFGHMSQIYIKIEILINRRAENDINQIGMKCVSLRRFFSPVKLLGCWLVFVKNTYFLCNMLKKQIPSHQEIVLWNQISLYYYDWYSKEHLENTIICS